MTINMITKTLILRVFSMLFGISIINHPMIWWGLSLSVFNKTVEQKKKKILQCLQVP